MPPVLVRREVRADHARVRGVHLAAFAREDGAPVAEADLVDRLRAGPWFLPALSLVALAAPDAPGADVVGHVIATRGTIEPSGAPALGLGPLGVVPAWQRRGVGSALMHALLGAAEATDETVVCLLGSPRYYCRFGFRPAVEAGIAAPDPAWGGAFQVRTFGTGRVPSGTFRYAAPFDEL
ncbi:putative acetyltransferase [Pseudonocardia thermophila]|uniref:Putative acetyltransferase n=1 Tax=Pseudonocardia thermophila TaxID=1848 RepID=A0A1M6YS79_PSETH|nr:putative acetyltransferase [Pseudonocardia thermophila]